MMLSHQRGAAARRLAALALALSLPSMAAAEAPRLGLPLDCAPHRTCFLQNEVDLDAGEGVRDRGCGGNSYDGLAGVDFRIASIARMQAGVEVLAAADGTVLRVRDGVADQLKADARQLASVAGIECGNGVVVDHGDGWEAQYCHLRRGSVRVKPGERLAKGQPIGLVGLSGETQFPHVHLALRHQGRVVDPFSGRSPTPAAASGGAASCVPAGAAEGLFDAPVAAAFAYREGEAFMAGFADHAVDMAGLTAQGELPPPAAREAAVLLFYGVALNARQGDRLRIALAGPGGVMAESTTEPLARHKAQYLLFAGKKRRAEPWPAGRYEGRFALLRNGATLWEETRQLVLE